MDGKIQPSTVALEMCGYSKRFWQWGGVGFKCSIPVASILRDPFPIKKIPGYLFAPTKFLRFCISDSLV